MFCFDAGCAHATLNKIDGWTDSDDHGAGRATQAAVSSLYHRVNSGNQLKATLM